MPCIAQVRMTCNRQVRIPIYFESFYFKVKENVILFEFHFDNTLMPSCYILIHVLSFGKRMLIAAILTFSPNFCEYVTLFNIIDLCSIFIRIRSCTNLCLNNLEPLYLYVQEFGLSPAHWLELPIQNILNHRFDTCN